MDSLGEYEYSSKDLIGHGAFAVVYKGRVKEKPHQVVAIKSITKKNLAKSQSLLSKEIKILKTLTELRHEHIVALLDCKETSNHVHLVMEYCNGGDLADYLHAKGTLSEDTIRLFLRQLAGAMRALHAKGIIHRDLKPQNILLWHTATGRCRPAPHQIRLKIADFGFARFLQDGVMAATLCGSPMYMAPEVIMSVKYDLKADLWSLGTIVFQCLAGKAPFHANTPQALKLFYERNVNLSPKIPHGTSPELSDLLTRLLKRNACDRMSFDAFFSHSFLHVVDSSPSRLGGLGDVSMPANFASVSPTSYCAHQLPPLSLYEPHSPLHGALPPPLQPSPPSVPPSAPPSTPTAVPSPDLDEEGFVIVHTDLTEEVCQPSKHARSPTRSQATGGCVTLMAEAQPVPSQRRAYRQLCRSSSGGSGSSDKQDPAPTVGSCPDGQQPESLAASSLTPPTVQFMLGPSSPLAGSPRQWSLSGSPGPRGSPLSPRRQHPPTTPPAALRAPVCEAALPAPSPTTDRSLVNMRSIDSAPNIRSLGGRAVTFPDVTYGGYLSSAGRGRAGGGGGPVMAGFQRSRTDSNLPLMVRRHLANSSAANNNMLVPYQYHQMTAVRTAARTSSPSSLPPGLMATAAPCGGFPESPHMAAGFGPSPPSLEPPLMFAAPELKEETLLDDAHNDTLTKLNFIGALVQCIVELAETKATPFTALTESVRLDASTSASESRRRLEQLVLHARALQLLSSALSMAKERLRSRSLHPTAAVRKVLSEMNDTFRQSLYQCQLLDRQTPVQETRIDVATCHGHADRLLYSHAIDMCQHAALDELFGNRGECFHRYRTAHILLHALSQQTRNEHDKRALQLYKDAVEKRLYVLKQMGINIYTVGSPGH